jgi:hypothetical protein
MPDFWRCGSLGIPSVHRKLGISTSNHAPVDGITGHDSTNFTSEFLQRSHGFVPYINGWSTLLRGRGRSRTWRQHRQLADLLPLHRTTKVGGMTHHPKLGNHFADQLSMTEKSHHRTLRNHNAHRLGHSTHVGGSKCDGCRVPAARPLVRPGRRGSGTRKGQFRRGSPRTRHPAAPIP